MILVLYPLGITRDGEREEFLDEEVCLEHINLHTPGAAALFSGLREQCLKCIICVLCSPEVSGAPWKPGREAAQIRDLHSNWTANMYARF